jgi:glutamyl-Q tRNA(Asp) synthetase
VLTTRFAPSPTGALHLGHAYSARCAFDAARAVGGRCLLRIEDIDRTRCRPELEAGLRADLTFLGLFFDGPVRRQSEHMVDYEQALRRLDGLGVLYPCFCTRAAIAAEIAQAPSARNAESADALGPRYPGLCRDLPRDEACRRIAAGQTYALRLCIDRALAVVQSGPSGSQPLVWHDRHAGRIVAEPQLLGDVVLARRDIRTSYHLAVTVDDHMQGVTLVTRGEDLFHATHIHRLLQALLGLDTPEYAHHRLLRDVGGQRLAKRSGAESIASLRAAGHSAAELWARIGLLPISAPPPDGRVG